MQQGCSPLFYLWVVIYKEKNDKSTEIYKVDCFSRIIPVLKKL